MKILHWVAVLTVALPGFGLLSENSAIASDITRQLRQSNFGSSSSFQRKESDRQLEAGLVQFKQGNSQRAIQLWNSAAESYRLLNDLEGQQRSFEYLSQAYQLRKNPTELEYALRQQLRFARARRDFPALVGHYNQVGELLLAKSSSLESEKTFTEALRIAENLQDVAGQGRSTTNLGFVALQQGNHAKAVKYLTQAVAFQQRTSNVNAEAIAQNALGIAYGNLGESQKSAGSYLNALILARTGNDITMQDRAMAGLAIVYRNLGANQEAKYWLETRLASSSGTTTLARITAFRAMAEFYQRTGDLAQTDRYYRDAIVMASQGGYEKEAKELTQQLENLRRIHHLGPKQSS